MLVPPRPDASAGPWSFWEAWRAACVGGEDELAALVAGLPADLELEPCEVVDVADVLGASHPARARAHAALLRALAPAHAGTLDLTTIIASAPGADRCVLQAALDVLRAAGHPSRSALLRAAVRTTGRDAASTEHAWTVVSSLLPARGEEEAAVVERCRPHVASPDEPGAAAATQKRQLVLPGALPGALRGVLARSSRSR